MATPPTRVLHSTPAIGYGSATTPKTTPTFDVVDGDLLTIIGVVEHSPTTLSTPTTTATTGGFTLQQSVVVSNYCPMYLWTADVTATQTGRTVSMAAVGGHFYGFGVTVWRDHGGLGNTAKTNVSSGAPSLAITCSDNSAVHCGTSDWNSGDGASRVWRTINGSAMAESLYFRNSANYTTYAGYRADIGAAGSVTVGLTAPTAQKYSIGAVEILGLVAATDEIMDVTTAPRQSS